MALNSGTTYGDVSESEVGFINEPFGINEQQSEVRKLQDKVSELQDEIKDLQDEVKELRMSKLKLENGKQGLENENLELENEKRELENEKRELQGEMQELTNMNEYVHKYHQRKLINSQNHSNLLRNCFLALMIMSVLGYKYSSQLECPPPPKCPPQQECPECPPPPECPECPPPPECPECPPPPKCPECPPPPKCPPLPPALTTLSEFYHVITDIAEFVPVRYADTPWQLWIEKYWHFDSVTVWVMKIGDIFWLKLRVQYTLRSIESIAASVIVQVLNPSGYNHHVSRTDVKFQADTTNGTWYTADTYKLLELTGENKKFYPGPDSLFNLRIVNIEVGRNVILPFHFSMCHVKYYQQKDLEWYTFPFYLRKYKFMIYIYANGFGYSKGRSLILTVYRMKGKNDNKIPTDIESGKIILKLRTKDGEQTMQLRISGKAGEIVKKGTKVTFVQRHQFPLEGYRSEEGVSVNIFHSYLKEYIDNDCFIFDVISGIM